MLDRIEIAFERQRQFAGDAAHELRTPLSMMRSRVEIALNRDRPAEDYRTELSLLNADLERLSRLATDLLQITQSESGQMNVHLERFDLSQTIDAVLAQYRDGRGAGLPQFTAQTSPTPIAADEDLIIQLFVNLLDNAIAHTPPAGKIEVGCLADSGRARMWVADNGTGIPPEHRTRIFDRFYRVESGRTRGGTGLGLSICQSIVSAHGGTIALAETSGPGTRIDIHLPRLQTPETP
jgi:signal transduction histidine kinase